MAYKGNGNKTAEKVYKRLYTKLPLNCVVPAGQFTSTSEGDFNHPTPGHKTEFQWGGIRSSSDQDMSPRHPYKYHPLE